MHDQEATGLVADFDQRVQDLFVPPLYGFKVVDTGFVPLPLPSVKDAVGKFFFHFVQQKLIQKRTHQGNPGCHFFLEVRLVDICGFGSNNVEDRLWWPGVDEGDELLVV
jgi:hypothetical protein